MRGRGNFVYAEGIVTTWGPHLCWCMVKKEGCMKCSFDVKKKGYKLLVCLVMEMCSVLMFFISFLRLIERDIEVHEKLSYTIVFWLFS